MNLWKEFAALLPDERLLVGKVVGHNADGTSSIELPGAQVIRAQGQEVAVDLSAFVRGGRVQGEAPSLPLQVLPI